MLKNYKKAEKVTSSVVAGLGVATTALSSGAVASALTGIGVVVSVPLGAVGAVCGVVSAVLMSVNKKIEEKVNKHNRLSSLAVAKHATINAIVFEALVQTMRSQTASSNI